MVRQQKLLLQAVSKSFPGVKALDQVDFSLHTGEVHALCGENGAGKTTLMNILSGNLQPDQGSIILDGVSIAIKSQLEAQRKGIGIVYQEKSLVNGLSVADNIFAANQPTNRLGLIDRKALKKQTQQLLNRLGIDIHPHQIVANLSPGQQQMIEVAKALALNPDILILDEPTAALSDREAQILFELIAQLSASGKSIIYISHRLPEIFSISHRITILKDGVSQGTSQTADLDVDKIVRLMVGRDLKEVPYEDHRTDQAALRVQDFSGRKFSGISMEINAGEILGLSGLVGAGRTEFARTLFGVDDLKSGKIYIGGNEAIIDNATEAIRQGIGYLPEDRKRLGIFAEMSIKDNLDCVVRNTQPGTTLRQKKRERQLVEIVQQLRIKAPSLTDKMIHLSGGNQQKVILARWLLADPKILIVDEPTVGIDVGAKYEVYQILRNIVQQGKSVLFISSDLSELMSNCDRIIVFRSGSICAEFDRPMFNEEKIMHHATGTIQ